MEYKYTMIHCRRELAAKRAEPAWRDSDLGRLAVRAANWLTYDQAVVALCRQALALGFTRLTSGQRDIYCAGYLHGEACAREAWDTFWSN